MKDKDWDKMDEKKRIIEEVKASVYMDIITRLAKKDLIIYHQENN